MATSAPDLIVLHEHPEWQKPLFAALERRGVSFAPFDVTRAAFSNVEVPPASLYFNQASPSAYLRGHTRAVPLALAYMRSLELLGARVLNGADVFALELSKSAQATLLRTLGIDCPRSITFNDVSALRALRDGPALAGAAEARPGRQRRAHSGRRVAGAGRGDLHRGSGGLAAGQSVPAAGISAARPRAGHRPAGVSRRRAALRDARQDARALQSVPVTGLQSGRRHRRVCRRRRTMAWPTRPSSSSRIPTCRPTPCETAKRIVQAARLDVGGIEYLETDDGRRVFYDINANSNLRPSVAAAFGFDPFERVVDFLVSQLQKGS